MLWISKKSVYSVAIGQKVLFLYFSFMEWLLFFLYYLFGLVMPGVTACDFFSLLICLSLFRSFKNIYDLIVGQLWNININNLNR